MMEDLLDKIKEETLRTYTNNLATYIENDALVEGVSAVVSVINNSGNPEISIKSKVDKSIINILINNSKQKARG